MYAKYRIFLETTRGGYYVAASNSVNGLSDMVKKWFNDSPIGRSVYDDMVQYVVLMQLDKDTGQYVREKKLPAGDRRAAIAQVRAMGAR
jgi:hypothetical protein